MLMEYALRAMTEMMAMMAMMAMMEMMAMMMMMKVMVIKQGMTEEYELHLLHHNYFYKNLSEIIEHFP
jgi:hypothetical protein